MNREYSETHLDRSALPVDPFTLFFKWREAAEDEPWGGAAMVLSTVGEDSAPSSRVVLLRDVADGAFCFYTNYQSRKGLELASNAACSLVFWWPSLVRQVRIEGVAEKLPPEVSDAYFVTRPRGSRIGAWASPQSDVIPDRSSLEANFDETLSRFAGAEVPRPPHWGGYGVVPQQIEFWQGGEARLHDRFRYTRSDDGDWQIARLAP